MEMTARKPKKEKRHVHHLNFTVRTADDYLMVADQPSTKNMMFGIAIDTIRYGIVNGKDSVDVFNVYDNGRNNVVSLKKTEWAKTLKSAMKFYSKSHEYEKCIDVQQLLNIL
jgi:hypothetical protein